MLLYHIKWYPWADDSWDTIIFASDPTKQDVRKNILPDFFPYHDGSLPLYYKILNISSLTTSINAFHIYILNKLNKNNLMLGLIFLHLFDRNTLWLFKIRVSPIFRYIYYTFDWFTKSIHISSLALG